MAERQLSPIERRRHPRTMVQMSLRGVRLDPEEGEIIDSLRMVDISKGGMGVYSDRPAYPGQRFILCLPVDTGGRRNMYATVMRCSQNDAGYRLGMQFDAISAGNWGGVSSYVAAAA